MNFRHPERKTLVLTSRLLSSQEVCCKLQRGSIYILISVIAGRGIKWHGRILSYGLSFRLTLSNARKFVRHQLASTRERILVQVPLENTITLHAASRAYPLRKDT